MRYMYVFTFLGHFNGTEGLFSESELSDPSNSSCRLAHSSLLPIKINDKNNAT